MRTENPAAALVGKLVLERGHDLAGGLAGCLHAAAVKIALDTGAQRVDALRIPALQSVLGDLLQPAVRDDADMARRLLRPLEGRPLLLPPLGRRRPGCGRGRRRCAPVLREPPE